MSVARLLKRITSQAPYPGACGEVARIGQAAFLRPCMQESSKGSWALRVPSESFRSAYSEAWRGDSAFSKCS